MFKKILKYEVIDIIDKFSILINYGEEQGAKKGDKTRIVVEGRGIYDTKKNFLGTLDIIKDELEIVTVYNNFSICNKIKKKARKNPYEIPDLKASLLAIYDRQKKLQEYIEQEYIELVPLHVDEKDFTNDKLFTKEPIKKGDLVKIIK